MSTLEATHDQAAHTLKLIGDQGLDREQVRILHLCLPLLLRGIKERMFTPKILRATLVAERAKIKHVVDFDKHLNVPSGFGLLPDWEQLPHRIKGVMEYNPAKVALYLDKVQQQPFGLIHGHELRKKLESVPVYGDQLLDLYFANQYLIPEGWGDVLFFWGTIYRDAKGNLYVRYLYRSNGQWWKHYLSLDMPLHSNFAAVVAPGQT
jgi:hypothetical protein